MAQQTADGLAESIFKALRFHVKDEKADMDKIQDLLDDASQREMKKKISAASIKEESASHETESTPPETSESELKNQEATVEEEKQTDVEVVVPEVVVEQHKPQAPDSIHLTTDSHSNVSASPSPSLSSRKNSDVFEDVNASAEAAKPEDRLLSTTDKPASTSSTGKTAGKIPNKIAFRRPKSPLLSRRSVTNNSELNVSTASDNTRLSMAISQILQEEREWFKMCSSGDFDGCAKTLMKTPDIAGAVHYVNGYTGLHWAARHGNKDLIRLLAGQYRVDVNIKSNGGYTPLHLAYAHDHLNVVQLLIDIYHADQSIRDNSGRLGKAYRDNKMGTRPVNFRQLQRVPPSVYCPRSTSSHSLNQLTATNISEGTALHRSTLDKPLFSRSSLRKGAAALRSLANVATA